MMTMSLHLRFLILAAVILLPSVTPADEARVAVAANFSPVAKELRKRFEAKTSHTLVMSYGSSGAFYAQIRNGAPYDAFLSADSERPKKLEEEKHAVDGSRFTYAVGKLVLWSARPGLVDQKGDVLARGNFRELAIADPKTAPYGAAARETLLSMKLWNKLSPKLVQGVDVTQTYQFIASGNAELGFLAYSQILALKEKTRGSWWVVPQNLYQPIRQQAVLLSKGENNRAARGFLEFLKSKEAADLIRSNGYGLEGKL